MRRNSIRCCLAATRVYQAALIALTGICILAYAQIWRINAAETLASVCATVAATALTLLLLDVDFNTSNVIAVANPLEKMLTFADASTANVANGSSRVAVVLLLMEGFAWVLARYTFVLHSSPRPTVF